MKIYFAGSIRGGRQDKKTYEILINHLKNYGNVLTEHVADFNLTKYGERSNSDSKIFDRDIKWLYESNVFVADISQPSIGVGYELRHVEEHGIPNLCLFRNRRGLRPSPMISGNDRFNIFLYRDINEALKIVDAFFTGLSSKSKVDY